MGTQLVLFCCWVSLPCVGLTGYGFHGCLCTCHFWRIFNGADALATLGVGASLAKFLAHDLTPEAWFWVDSSVSLRGWDPNATVKVMGALAVRVEAPFFPTSM